MSRTGRPFDLQPVSPISLIGHNTPSLAALMHRGVCFKKMTTKWSKAAPSVATATLAQAFKVILNLFLLYRFQPALTLSFQGVSTTTRASSVTLHKTLSFLMNFKNIPLLPYLTQKTLCLVAANQRIGKGPKCPIIECRCHQSTSSQAPPKRKAPTSTKTQPKRQKAAPSSPSHLAP